MPQLDYKGIYASMTFPPYKFVEYPKQVIDKQGKPRIVSNQREELAIAAEPDPMDGGVDVSPQAEAMDKMAEENALLKEQMANIMAELSKLRKVAVPLVAAQSVPVVDPLASDQSPEALSKRNLAHPQKAQKG